MKEPRGYILIMLMVVLTILSLGLMIAVPVWQTQIQRENEEELVFRGNQYVEAIRLFQLKNPGKFPGTIEELVEEKCLRRPYKDPMIPGGDWNIILQQEGMGTMGRQTSIQPRTSVSQRTTPGDGQTGQSFSAQKVMVAPFKALSNIRNAQILGVVSASTKKSIRIYKEQESYDKWLFFYGQDQNKQPEIVYYGQPAKTP